MYTTPNQSALLCLFKRLIFEHMTKYQIVGGSPLKGSLSIAGRKNAALKLIAASLLTTGTVTIKRMPQIGDVEVMLEIMVSLGAEVNQVGLGHYQIRTDKVSNPEIPLELGRKLRASLVLVGPLLARFGWVKFPHPGGCVIGKRTIEPHLAGFKHLGTTVERDDQFYYLKTNELIGSDVYLKDKSVTGTENMIMAATLAKGETKIIRAAEEPHITNLCNLLRLLGYQIKGDGTSTITLTGQPLSSSAAEIEVIPDDIEVGTFAVASAITGGGVTLLNCGPKDLLYPILDKLEDFNVQHQYNQDTESLEILASPNLKASSVQTNPWPGFLPDLQSPFTVLATQATGTSLIHDWMYEGRLYFVDQLQRMGANIVICDPHRALVSGPSKLYRANIISPDLRAGAALVLAALIAEGETIIEHAEIIDRGYELLEERLQSIGANIKKID